MLLSDRFQIKDMEDLEVNIKDIEGLVRHSKAYKDWAFYFLSELGLVYSVSFPDINFLENDVDLEVHHIITLWDIIVMTGINMISELNPGEYLTVFDIAKKVLTLHMEDKIPVIVLSTTEHQLYHAGLWLYSKDHPCIHLGDTEGFLKEFSGLLSEDQKKILRNAGVDINE